MREIKFRAWDKKESKFTKGIDGISLDGEILDLAMGDGYITQTAELERYELMQYTGLKDSKGKDIYESDIIKDYGHIEKKNRVVMWNYSGFYLDYSGTPLSTAQDVEVIGNIYQNPNLL